jgi:hypothetical protein
LLAIGPGYLLGSVVAMTVVLAWPVALGIWHRLAEWIIRKPHLMFIRRSLDRRGVRY